MTFTKIAWTQNLNVDTLKAEKAKAQYIALQNDSILNVYYDIQIEMGKTIKASRIELNRYIKGNEELRESNTELLKQLVKLNNQLARARKRQLTWFLVGAGIGVGIETISIITGVLISK